MWGSCRRPHARPPKRRTAASASTLASATASRDPGERGRPMCGGEGWATWGVVSYRSVEISMALGLTGTLLTALVTVAPPPASPAQALARRVDERQKNVRDLTARFVQSYRSGVLGREVVERGTLA